MIRDRGTMKWTAFMMPEHVKSLKDFDLGLNKVQKPELDDNQLEEINTIICEAMEYNKEVVFTYYDKGDIKLYVGQIHFIDNIRNEIRLIDNHKDVFIIKFEDVLRVDFHEV
ncbi:YolD-like family protein [Metabacillus niabensis]|uniref:YolD-like family protein n=1 Tax=Metabacillus niabensis TaxID=324854 RepID=UPI0039A0A3BB